MKPALPYRLLEKRCRERKHCSRGSWGRAIPALRLRPKRSPAQPARLPSPPKTFAAIAAFASRAVSGFRGGWNNHAANCRDASRREAALARMVAHGLFVRRDINAVDLVVGDVAFHPLHLGHRAQHAARLLRDALQLRRCQLPRTWNFPLDQKLRHLTPPR